MIGHPKPLVTRIYQEQDSRVHPRERAVSNISSTLAILLVCLSINCVQAQGVGRFAATPDVSTADCEQLAGMPNAPMSVEACKAMMGMAKGFEAAAADPGAQRPGDDAMSCSQIFAELKTMAGVGISDATTKQSAAVVNDGTALATRQAGELTAFIAESYALGAGAGLLSAYTPNFVGAAIAAAWQAKLMALAAKAQAEQAPINARINQAMLANTGEMSRAMQSNPRFARLAQLGMKKNCEPPAGDAK